MADAVPVAWCGRSWPLKLLAVALGGNSAGFLAEASSLRANAGQISVDIGDGGPGAGSSDDKINAYMKNIEASGVSNEDVTTAEEALNMPPRNATAESLAPRRTVVVARYDEDISWLQQLPNNFYAVVYQSGNSTEPHFVENVGNEASKYLSYIVENYENLPDSVAFIQARRQDWHDPIPKDVSLRAWDWARAQQGGGFHFLPTNAPCIVEDSVKLAPHEPPPVPPGEQCVALVEHHPKQMASIQEAWPQVFASELGPLPQRWLTRCCAQFEVTREAIQRHSLNFYQGLLSWVETHDRDLQASSYGNEMKRNHDPERRDAGHVMEPLWVLLFSDPNDPAVRLPELQADASDEGAGRAM